MNSTIPSSSSSHEAEESEQDESHVSVTVQSQLATKILENLNGKDLLSTPIQYLNVNWDKIKCKDMTTKEMKSAWKQILSKVCVYRTVADVVYSFRENPYRVVTEEDQQWNTKVLSTVDKQKERKKAKEKPKYAMKPLSGYQLFCKQAFRTEHLTMKDAALKWSLTPEKERSFYAEKAHKEYKDMIETYMMEHPDDEDAQSFLKSANEKAQKARLKNANKRKKSEDNGNETSFPKSPKKMPGKKKPKIIEKKTGLSFFIERRKEELKLENPNWGEEKIMAKLEKKYNNLSDKKRTKYEKMAEEENNSDSG